MIGGPLLKKKKSSDEIDDSQEKCCVICGEACREKPKNLNQEQWDSFKELALSWNKIDGKFSHVFDTVSWDAGPNDQLWHKDCKWKMANKRTLLQATSSFNKSSVSCDANESSSVSSDSILSSQLKPSTRSTTGVIHDKSLCIWCMKGDDEKHPGRDKFRLLEQREVWLKFKASILYVEDYELRTRLRTFVDSTPDPFAIEVRYHEKCRKKYMEPVYHPKVTDHLQHINHNDMKQLFFQHVRDTIFENGEARTLKSLCMDYERIRLDFGVTSIIKSSYVKELLFEEFRENIGFHDRYHKNKSTIVFNREDTGSYIESAINFWGISTDDILKVAAKRIKEETLKRERKFPWPPRVDQLTDFSPRIVAEPGAIQRFLNYLVSGRKDGCQSQVHFLTDAIEFLVTKNPTQLPSIVSMVIHGLTRSKKMVQLLSDLGVGISYDRVMSLYEVWTYTDVTHNRICPAEIAENVPGTVVIDNDDFQDDTLTGDNTSHRTNMMFVQPEKFISSAEQPIISLKRTNKGELKQIIAKEHAISPYTRKTRGEPKQFEKVDTAPKNTAHIRHKLFAHAMVRCDTDGSARHENDQKIGAFTGFMNEISEPENRSKAYYHLTLPKSPSKRVVYTTMENAAEAAKLKGMPFIQFVGDLPVFVLIEELKSENPEKFESILPVLGTFHTQCAFMSAIYRRFKGSGLDELLVNAGLIAEGSVEQALKGKHYSRALRVYKLLYEALARHLIRCGRQQSIFSPKSINYLLEIISDSELDSADRLLCLDMLVEDSDFGNFIETLFNKVRGPEFHMAAFVISLMEMIEILLMNIDSIRTHNWKRYLESLRLMMPWMMIYDNVNYGRWLPVYWSRMKCLSKENEAYMPHIFAQSLTTNPYSAQPMDMWIEVTMNKGSKLKSGWSRLLTSETGLFMHVKNANNINSLTNSLSNFLSEASTSNSHKENVTSRRRADEKAVECIVSLLTEWDCDPWDTSKQDLRTFQSGMLSTDELLNDFQSALTDGEDELSLSFEQRIFSKTQSVFDKFSRKKRLNFAAIFNMTPVNNKCKGNSMENEAMVSLIELARKKKPELFHDIWNYRITQHCLSVFNHDGTLRKCQKSKLIEMLTFSEVYPREYTAIIDMGYIWHICMPTADDREKEDFTKYTWHDYAGKVYDTVKSRHPNATCFILANDYYGNDVINIKDSEHVGRGKKFMGGESQNVFPVSSQPFPSINQFKSFFRNKGNKQRLQLFLKKEFTTRAQCSNVSFLYCLRGSCEDISESPPKSRTEFTCDHIEADTSIFYFYSKVRAMSSNSTVVIDAEDTDVVALSAYVPTVLDGPLVLKRKKGFYDCHKLCNEDMAKVIVRLHVISGLDTISSFHGTGKRTIWKNVLRSKEAKKLLLDFSDDAMIKFIIRYVYNDHKSETLAEMREKRWNKSKKKSLVRVGIDEDTCRLRNKRVRFQTSILENFRNNDSYSNPTVYGGYMIENGICVPLRYNKQPLPNDLTPEEFPEEIKDAESNSDDNSDGDESDEEEDNDIDFELDI